MLKKFAIIIALLSFNSVAAPAQYNPFAFLRANMSARSAALAGAAITIPNDASLIFQNPALTATIDDNSISSTFLKHVIDINSGNISYIKKIHNVSGTFQANVSYISYGEFIKTDMNNNKSYTYNPKDLAFAIGYGNTLDTNLYYGANLKYIYSTIDKQSSSAIALDVGLLYQMPDIHTDLAFSILNAGMQLSTYNINSEKLPLDVRLGVSHKLKGLPLLANFSFHHLSDPVDNFMDKFLNFSLGGEFYFGEIVRARIGYDNYIRRYTASGNSKGITGLSFGAGIKYAPFVLDYAFSRIGLGANLHRISINFNF